jgi:hypothetical protein
VPIKIFVSLNAKEEIRNGIVKFELTSAQLEPLLVDKKIPSLVPAKRLVPLIAKQWIILGNLLLSNVQLIPSLIERKTLPSCVPANIFVPLTARA